MIRRDSVFERMRPAGVLRNVAADGTSALAAGIRSIVEAVLLHCFRQINIDASGLGNEAAVLGINLDYLVHPNGRNNDTAARRGRAAGEPGTCAARNEWDAKPVT